MKRGQSRTMDGSLPKAVHVSISSDERSHVTAPVLSNVHVHGNVNIPTYISGTYQPAPSVQDCGQHSKIREYKTSVLTSYKTVKEYNSLPGQDVLLADRYTEPLIVQRHRLQKHREEELRSRGEALQQVLHSRASEAHSRIALDQLFKPNDQGLVPRAVILQGNSGHGKSFTAQKIMHDWTSECLFKEFLFVFHLNCKELSLISGEHSVLGLLRCDETFAPVILKVLQDTPGKVLFLIDGFDEFRFPLKESGLILPCDPSECAPVEATLRALLKGTVLSQCFLLVTTRSTASDKLSELLKTPQRFTEILGFSENGVKDYFQRFFSNRMLSDEAYECVKSNETLFTSCFIPIICWIVCTVFKEHFQESVDTHRHFKTTSSIFVDFINTLMKYHSESPEQPDLSLLRSLGQLAERGMEEHQVLFNKKIVSEVFFDFGMGNPFLCKFLMKKNIYKETMYSFMHQIFQEFFAALHYFLINETEEACGKLQILLQSTIEEVEFSGDFKEVLEEDWNNHVVQFLFGLSNSDVCPLVKTHSWSAIRAQLKEWVFHVIKAERKNIQHKIDTPLLILHCLYEINEREFVMQVIEYWAEIVVNIYLQRRNCWVLLYCLQCCLSIRRLMLYGLTAENLRMLKPALCKCKKLELSVEDLSDSDVGDLISALGEENRIDTLRVYCKLSPDSVEHILRALHQQKCVRHVSLHVKNITLDTAAMSLHLIQNTEISESGNCLWITWPNGEGCCSSLFFEKHPNILRLHIIIDPVMVPETVISRIDLTFSPCPKMANIDFLQEIYTLRSLREKPECEKHVDALLSSLRSLPGLREVGLTVDCVTERWAVGILSVTDNCPIMEKMHIVKEPPHCLNWFTSDTDSFCSLLSVEKDSSKRVKLKLRFSVREPRCETPDATLTLKHNSNSALKIQGFLQKFHTLSVLRKNSPGYDEHVNALMSSLHSLPGLEEVELLERPLTLSLVTGSLNLIQTCPSLQKLQIKEGIFPSLFVTKDSSGLRLDVKCGIGSAATVSDVPIKMSVSSDTATFDFTDNFLAFCIRMHTGKNCAASDELVDTLIASLCSVLGLREVDMTVRFQSVTWVTRSLCLIQTCPSLQKLQVKVKWSSSSFLSVTKDAVSLRLDAKDLSDSDADDVISALGEGKMIHELRISSSLSAESVEHILRALHKQRCVGVVLLLVKNITLDIAAMALYLIQTSEILESGNRLCIQTKSLTNKEDSEVKDLCSVLSVEKDSSKLKFSIRGTYGTPYATVTLAHSKSAINFQDLLKKFHTLDVQRNNSPGYDEHVNALMSSLHSLPGLEEVELLERPLTLSLVTGSLNLIQTCPSLQKLQIKEDTFPFLHVSKDSSSLRLEVLNKSSVSFGSDTEKVESAVFRISLSLSHSSVTASCDLTGFLLNFFSSKHFDDINSKPDEHKDALMSLLHSLPGLRGVKLVVNCLTVGWANRILSLIHSCPTIQNLHLEVHRLWIGSTWTGGFLMEEGIRLLQTSQKRPDCTLILRGERCSKAISQCSEEKDWHWRCNQHVEITIQGASLRMRKTTGRGKDYDDHS